MKELEKYLEEMESAAAKTGVEAIIRTNAGIFSMGDIFEAETVKGSKNYIVFMFAKKDWVYYCHGDKGKKVSREHFLKLIDYGDLVPIPRDQADPEKLSLSVLGLKAMSQGLAFNDYMKQIWGYGQGSEAGQF